MISYLWAGNGKMWSFYSLPFPSSHSLSHFHSHETFAIPIPMAIPMGMGLAKGPMGIPNIYSSLVGVYSNICVVAR